MPSGDKQGLFCIILCLLEEARLHVSLKCLVWSSVFGFYNVKERYVIMRNMPYSGEVMREYAIGYPTTKADSSSFSYQMIWEQMFKGHVSYYLIFCVKMRCECPETVAFIMAAVRAHAVWLVFQAVSNSLVQKYDVKHNRNFTHWPNWKIAPAALLDLLFSKQLERIVAGYFGSYLDYYKR